MEEKITSPGIDTEYLRQEKIQNRMNDIKAGLLTAAGLVCVAGMVWLTLDTTKTENKALSLYGSEVPRVQELYEKGEPQKGYAIKIANSYVGALDKFLEADPESTKAMKLREQFSQYTH